MKLGMYVARAIALSLSLFRCRVEAKKDRMRPGVKDWATMLAVLAVLSASLALAEDFKLINGKIYKNATISRIEADGIVLRTKTGISKVYFVELPKDVRDRFHYGPATPVAKQHERETIKLEGKQDGPSQADASGWTGWAAAMGDPAIFITVFVTGTVIIAGVVFAIVRTRSQ